MDTNLCDASPCCLLQECQGLVVPVPGAARAVLEQVPGVAVLGHGVMAAGGLAVIETCLRERESQLMHALNMTWLPSSFTSLGDPPQAASLPQQNSAGSGGTVSTPEPWNHPARAEGGGTGPTMTQTKLPLQLFPAPAAAGQLALGGRLELQEPKQRSEKLWDVQWCLKYSNMTGFSLEPRWVLVAQPVHLENPQKLWERDLRAPL